MAAGETFGQFLGGGDTTTAPPTLLPLPLQGTDRLPVVRDQVTYYTPPLFSSTVGNLVTDYGADPTGATDSTAAIIAWLEAGGDLYAPAGDYLIQFAGPDAGGATATVTNSINVVCAVGVRFFTDTADGLDNDMIRIQVPAAGAGLPAEGIDVVWRGGLIDQTQQKVSLVVPFRVEYPPPTGKGGSSNTCDGLSISGGYTQTGQDFLGMNRIEVSGVQIDAGTHWEVAGGDSGIVVAGAKEISVHDCTFSGSRDLAIYSSGTGTGNANPTGRIDLYNNFAANCFNGYAVKRSVHGFLFRGNTASNCVIGIQSTLVVGAGNAAGQILGNNFNACQVEIRCDISQNLYIAGNRGMNFGAYLADGTTPVVAYTPAGILLQGVTYSTIVDNGTDGVSASYVALNPSYLIVGAISATNSTNNRIANNLSVSFRAIGGERAAEADSNQFEGNWGFLAVVPNIVTTGALSSVKRHDYDLGNDVYITPLLFADGTSSDPSIGRFGDPTTGFYFGANTIGATRALIRAPATTLTGAGTNQATAFQTVAELNDFSTVAAGTGALLRAAVSGTVQVINNRGANPLLVYPQTGEQINSLGVNAAYTIPAGKFATFYCTLTASWSVPPPFVKATDVFALTDAASITVDARMGSTFAVTLTGNRTLSSPTGIVPGQRLTFAITQDGSGNRTLAYGGSYKFAGGVAPTLSTAAGAVDIINGIAITTTFVACTFTADVK